jgi:[glutamine synthetase] adenylyltransferase / [glutamine synthetase]-adenylyl-L-tyrosine phosphorylase
MPGGLIDIEFLAQYARLVAPQAEKIEAEQVVASGTALALKRYGQGLIGVDALETCVAALALYTELSQIIRLCVGDEFDPKDAPAGLIERLCAAADQPNLKLVETDIKRMAKAVRAIFTATLSLKSPPSEE